MTQMTLEAILLTSWVLALVSGLGMPRGRGGRPRVQQGRMYQRKRVAAPVMAPIPETAWNDEQEYTLVQKDDPLMLTGYFPFVKGAGDERRRVVRCFNHDIASLAFDQKAHPLSDDEVFYGDLEDGYPRRNGIYVQFDLEGDPRFFFAGRFNNNQTHSVLVNGCMINWVNRIAIKAPLFINGQPQGDYTMLYRRSGEEKMVLRTITVKP